MKIGSRDFITDGSKTYIMGILNVTPDSFSDGGRFYEIDKALKNVDIMVKDGADIIDVGGESTRPGASFVTVEEEINRVCPVIEAIKERFDIPISVDTYKPEVLDAAVRAGADMENDVWGFRYPHYEAETMAEVVAKYKLPVIIMHNDAAYDEKEDIKIRVERGLKESIGLALSAGVDKDLIVLDPGVGFAKSYNDNLQVIKHIGSYLASRKSVIGLTLDLPADQREEGTLVTTIIAAEAGCSFVRVHDVEKNARALKMYEAIREA